ncbi:hypothetical protein [Cysteiniphilum litorale]|uniref:hypothetical protein n=1 Tax=Cysteiniphilum litorale TaxID=2056700 RepID=UPI003F881EBE
MKKMKKMKKIVKTLSLPLLGMGLMSSAVAMTNYQGPNQTKALFILHNAHTNPLYKPVLEVPAKDNVKGHANVYQGEYAVYIPVKGNKPLLTLLKEVNTLAYPDMATRVMTTPHISIIQGVFKGKNYQELVAAVTQLAKNTKAQEVTLAKNFSVVGDTLSLDVAGDNAFLNELNAELTAKTHPNAPTHQTIVAIEEGHADLTQMQSGSAWRDYNIPGSNRSHITAVYNKGNGELATKANKLLNNKSYSIMVDSIAIAKMDDNGNLYGKPIFVAQFKS